MVAASSKAVGVLLIVSHSCHYEWDGRLFAHEPYAVEIEMWAEMFPRILIAAPLRRQQPPPSYVPFQSGNIAMSAQLETGGTTLRAKLRQIACIPLLLLGLARAMWRADAIQVRCPGNLPLLAVLLAPLFRKPLVARYTGQWRRYPGEAWSVALQRRLLAARWWRGPVTVYGTDFSDRKLIPFFTSMLTEKHLQRARLTASRDRGTAPFRLLYVGRLSPAKNIDILVRAVAALAHDAVPISLTIVGEGEERANLVQLAEELGASSNVRFEGWRTFEQVLTYYEDADALALLSNSEGWGKSAVEAMAFGLVCFGSSRGMLPQLLGRGRGIVVDPLTPANVARAVKAAAADWQSTGAMRAHASAWACQFSRAAMKAKLGEVLEEWWGVRVART